MIRGNHDYWWASANKMRNLMGDAITFLQGHGTAELIQTEEGPRIIAFGGTRAYLCPETPISHLKQTNPFTIEN